MTQGPSRRCYYTATKFGLGQVTGRNGSPTGIGPGGGSRRNSHVWIHGWDSRPLAMLRIAVVSRRRRVGVGRRLGMRVSIPETTLDCGADVWHGRHDDMARVRPCARRRRRVLVFSRRRRGRCSRLVGGQQTDGRGVRDATVGSVREGGTASQGGRRAQRPQDGGVALRYRLPPTAHRPPHSTAQHRIPYRHPARSWLVNACSRPRNPHAEPCCSARPPIATGHRSLQNPSPFTSHLARRAGPPVSDRPTSALRTPSPVHAPQLFPAAPNTSLPITNPNRPMVESLPCA